MWLVPFKHLYDNFIEGDNRCLHHYIVHAHKKTLMDELKSVCLYRIGRSVTVNLIV